MSSVEDKLSAEAKFSSVVTVRMMVELEFVLVGGGGVGGR